jgi:hypothetical protein
MKIIFLVMIVIFWLSISIAASIMIGKEQMLWYRKTKEISELVLMTCMLLGYNICFFLIFLVCISSGLAIFE